MQAFASGNLAARLGEAGRRPIVECYLEGMADVLCTEAPPDPWPALASIAFDGTTGEAASPMISTLITTGDFTVMAWVRPAAAPPAAYMPVLSWQTVWGDVGFSVGVNGATASAPYVPVLEIAPRGTVGYADQLISIPIAGAPALYPLDRWYMLAVSVGGVYGLEIRCQVWSFAANGDATISAVDMSALGCGRALRAPLWGVTAPVRLGRQAYGNRRFAGRIGHVAIFDRALTHAEIRHLAYRSVSTPWGAHWARCAGQWRLDEATGTRVRNSAASGSARDLTLSGGAAWVADAPYVAAHRPYLSVGAAVAEALEPRATRSRVSGLEFTILDSDGWLTRWYRAAGGRIRDRRALVLLGASGLRADEYEPVFAGAVEELSPLAGRGYALRLGDERRLARASLPLGATKLRAGIDAALGASLPVDSWYGFNATTYAARYVDPPPGQAPAQRDPAQPNSHPTGWLKIDDEVLFYHGVGELSATPTLGTVGLRRGEFGSVAAAHAAGAAVKEVLVVEGHPLDVALTLLNSATGDGAVDAAYDSLCRFVSAASPNATAGRGAGVPPAEIDVAGVQALRDATFGGWGATLFVDADVDDLKRYVEEQLLKPLGCYLYARRDGRLAVGHWGAPAGGVAALESADYAAAEPRLDVGALTNAIRANYDYSPTDGQRAGTLIFEDVSSAAAHGRAGVLDLTTAWVRTLKSDNATSWAVAPAALLGTTKATLFARFGAPLYAVDLDARLLWAPLEVGDGVYLASPELPDLVAGSRGLHRVLFQVIERALDLRRGRVRLKLIRV